jgi:hypothetical protein
MASYPSRISFHHIPPKLIRLPLSVLLERLPSGWKLMLEALLKSTWQPMKQDKLLVSKCLKA